jgi:hypothetical protein
VSEDGTQPEEGLSAEALAGHEATEVPAPHAMPATGDVAIPLDPDMAAAALLGQDEPEDPAAG